MGRFNWPELRALVVSIVESLSEDPPPELRDRWGDGWVSAFAVRNTLLGSWGPQVDEAEFDILVDELVDGCVLERDHGLLHHAGGTWSTVILRPLRKPRTEPPPAGDPPG